MKEKIAISVIIPFYNVEEYLGECLESLARQTFRNFEVILIDDGSTDKSGRIAQKYEGRFPRYKIITKINEGQGKARNIGLEAACGEYIYFLDSDDYIEDNALEIMYAQASSCDADLVLFNSGIFLDGKEGNLKGRNIYKRCKKYPQKVYGGQEAFSCLKRNGEYTCVVWLQLSKRRLLKNKNIRFPENVVFEDEYFSFRVFMESERVRITEDVVVHHRIRKDSTMSLGRNYQHFMSYAMLCRRVTEFYWSGKAERRWRWALRVQAADFFKGAVCRIYFKLPYEERMKVEDERRRLVQLGRQNICYGNWRVFFACYGWPLYLRLYDRKG